MYIDIVHCTLYNVHCTYYPPPLVYIVRCDGWMAVGGMDGWMDGWVDVGGMDGWMFMAFTLHYPLIFMTLSDVMYG